MITRSRCTQKSRQAFTLVEILVVMSIILLLMAFVAATLGSRTSHQDVSVTGHQVRLLFDRARQLAITHNQYVQVRFYSDASSSGNSINRIGTFLSESPYYGSDADYSKWSDLRQFRRSDRDFSLESGVVIAGEDGVSNLLKLLRDDADRVRTGTESLFGTNHNFVAFYYRPDGSTDFESINGVEIEPDDAYLSLVHEQQYLANASQLPANYYLFVFDPTTGRTVIVRP